MAFASLVASACDLRSGPEIMPVPETNDQDFKIWA